MGITTDRDVYLSTPATWVAEVVHSLDYDLDLQKADAVGATDGRGSLMVGAERVIV